MKGLPTDCPFWERHITLARFKNGELGYIQNKGEKTEAIMQIKKDMDEGAVYFVAWTGKWRTDLFLLTPDDVQRLVKEYIHTYM